MITRIVLIIYLYWLVWWFL